MAEAKREELWRRFGVMVTPQMERLMAPEKLELHVSGANSPGHALELVEFLKNIPWWPQQRGMLIERDLRTALTGGGDLKTSGMMSELLQHQAEANQIRKVDMQFMLRFQERLHELGMTATSLVLQRQALIGMFNLYLVNDVENNRQAALGAMTLTIDYLPVLQVEDWVELTTTVRNNLGQLTYDNLVAVNSGVMGSRSALMVMKQEAVRAKKKFVEKLPKDEQQAIKARERLVGMHMVKRLFAEAPIADKLTQI